MAQVQEAKVKLKIKSKVESKEESTILSSKYQTRKELLISGYADESLEGITIPMVILKYIEKLHSATPKLQMKLITFGLPILLECYVTNSMNNLLNVQKYKLIVTALNKSPDETTPEPQKIVEKIYEPNDLCYGIFELKQLTHSFQPKNFFLQLLKEHMIVIKYELFAYNNNEEIIEKLKGKINWNIIQNIKPLKYPDFQRSWMLELPNIIAGYDLKQFQSIMEKQLKKLKFENVKLYVKRLFYFAVWFRDNKNQEIIQVHQLYQIRHLKISYDHDFKKIQTILKQTSIL